jgi:hypothetical protein
MLLIIVLVVMGAEGLHWLIWGKVPELIEWQPKRVPVPEQAGRKTMRKNEILWDETSVCAPFSLPFVRSDGDRCSDRFDGLAEEVCKVGIESFADPQKRIDGGQAFSFFNPANHCVAQAGTRSDLVQRQFLSKPLLTKRINQLGNNCFALRCVEHPVFLSEESPNSGYDHRRNLATSKSDEKNRLRPTAALVISDLVESL